MYTLTQYFLSCIKAKRLIVMLYLLILYHDNRKTKIGIKTEVLHNNYSLIVKLRLHTAINQADFVSW